MEKKGIYGKIVSDKYVCKKNEFILYDLKINIVQSNKNSSSEKSEVQDIFNSRIGYYFELIGENLYLPEGQPFSIFDLSSVLPLLAAKQRLNNESDWIESDNYISVADPGCTYMLYIERTNLRCFRKEETTEI